MTRHDSERRFVRQKKFRSEAVKGAKNARLESLATCRLEAGVMCRPRFLWAATTPRALHLRHATLGITRDAAFGDSWSRTYWQIKSVLLQRLPRSELLSCDGRLDFDRDTNRV